MSDPWKSYDRWKTTDPFEKERERFETFIEAGKDDKVKELMGDDEFLNELIEDHPELVLELVKSVLPKKFEIFADDMHYAARRLKDMALEIAEEEAEKQLTKEFEDR